MKTNYFVSALALFLLLIFLAVWFGMLLLDKPIENDIIKPPSIDPPAALAASQSNEPMPESEATPIAVEYLSSSDESVPEPEISFSISATETYPGEYLVLYAYGNIDASQITVSSPFSRDPVFFEQGDHLAALYPIKYTYEPGEYTLTLSAEDISEQFVITLLSKQWQTQALTVDGEVVNNTIESNSANEEYNDKVAPKKNLFEAQPLWQGSFIQPVAGRITTEFGMLRTVNGVPSDRHGGVDIAAARGTEIAASNSGKVIFSDHIALTGNTICIEHGMGLKTWYYHMDQLAVSEGESVVKGQKIGEVGSTGFSTGPHLHWAASVFNVYVNPWTLVEAEPKI